MSRTMKKSAPEAKDGPSEDEANKAMLRSLAKTETKVVKILRIIVLAVLLVSAVCFSCGVFIYTRNQETHHFTTDYEDSAYQVLENIHESVERQILGSALLSSSLTSYALSNNLSFPFVTLPDMELLGSFIRVQSGAHFIHYTPIVTDDKRDEWEAYALEHRSHIDRAFQKDQLYRHRQDVELGINQEKRDLQEVLNLTVLDDGTDFHPKIWDAVLNVDSREDSGPYLPIWQRR